MFDPFDDFEQAGYLRNTAKAKEPQIIKVLEHQAFITQLPAAHDYLLKTKKLNYSSFLETHRILFSDFYPWAGQDRTTTAPHAAIEKSDILFAHPESSRLAVEHALELGQNKKQMRQTPGLVMGLFAYGHPFLDGNGRTMLVVHAELCHRAGFSISWEQTNKDAYLSALTDEIKNPKINLLDEYLRPFIGPSLSSSNWQPSLLSIPGLHGLDEGRQIDGDLREPAVLAKYRAFHQQREKAGLNQGMETEPHKKDSKP